MTHILKIVFESLRRFFLTSLYFFDQDPILKELKLKGLVVIPKYFTIQQAEKIESEIDDYLKIKINNKNLIWSDDALSDFRIFNSESKIKSKLIKKFLNDPFIENIRKKYTGRNKSKKSVLAAKLISKQGNLGSGGGWHFDSPYSRQFKALMYLSDVTIDNGPYAYIEKSSSKWLHIKCFFKGLIKPGQYRFTNNEVMKISNKLNLKNQIVTGTKGDLILVDVTAFHRGQPIKSGTRHAITLYCSD